MRIFVLDLGWEGYAVAIADTEEEAFKYMKEGHPRIGNEWSEGDIPSYPMVKGYVDGSLGDA